MKKGIIILLIISITLFITAVFYACSKDKSDLFSFDAEEEIFIQLFYESRVNGYQPSAFIWSLDGIYKYHEQLERGFTNAISTTALDSLADMMTTNSDEILMEYGQLFEYKQLPEGEFYLFSGNYPETNQFTLITVQDNSIFITTTEPCPDSFFYGFYHDNESVYLVVQVNIEDWGEESDFVIYKMDYLNEECSKIFALNQAVAPIEDMLHNYITSTIENGIYLGLYTDYLTEDSARSIVFMIDLNTNCSYLYSADYYGKAVSFIDGLPCVVMCDITNGDASFPVKVSYFDKELNLLDQKEVVNDSVEYRLKCVLLTDSYVIFVADAKDWSHKSIIIAEQNVGSIVYQEKLKAPLKDATLINIVFLKKDGLRYIHIE